MYESYIYIYIHTHIHTHVCILCMYVYIYIYTHLSIYLSIYLSVYLSIYLSLYNIYIYIYIYIAPRTPASPRGPLLAAAQSPVFVQEDSRGSFLDYDPPLSKSESAPRGAAPLRLGGRGHPPTEYGHTLNRHLANADPIGSDLLGSCLPLSSCLYIIGSPDDPLTKHPSARPS